ncbi:hypothetical protein C8245_02835 [Paracidovorax avenae]|uniref:PAAR-like domain-containing protein n=1 Tax=Paracidovorax avenae TaxID=80867 RepID=UPI000D225C1E|nr:PAAR-like domain-containing protein [Paracidovorax avenae]AVS64770.1 hypothetical protein C8245_02835 [Paracidovorax avenae]
MAKKHIACAEAVWRAICTAPDVCKVGDTPVPFDSFRDLSNQLRTSPNVYARGKPVYRLTDWVRGTDANAGKGVVSQTSQQPGHVRLIGDNTSVKVNGLVCARHDTVVQMNVGPGGPNTVGKLVTEQGEPAGTVKNGKLPCNDPPKTSDRLQKLEKLKQELSFMDPDQLDKIVQFDELNKMADGGIASINVKDEGGWSTAGNYGTQALRGVLGFVKDLGVGIGELAYTVGKKVNIAGAIHSNLDAAILAENIVLGNVCLASVKEGAAAAVNEVIKPVTEPWKKGDYVESVTRGGLEIGTAVFAIGDVAKAAQGAKAASAAAKASEAAKAAEATKAAEAARAAEAAEAAKAAEAAEAADAAKAGDAAKGNGVKIEKLTNHEKGAIGEKTGHQAMVDKKMEPVGKTDGVYEPGKNGIDGVYKNPNPPPDYVIAEYKYGSAKLEKGLADGTNQMDDAWVDKRLVEKVGKEQAEAIRDAMDAGKVEKWLVRVDENGATTATKIGKDGNVLRGKAGKVAGFP